MSDRKLQCDVITPEKILYSGQVDMVVAPAACGEIGILPLHAPIVTTLNVGELRLKHGPDHQDYIAIDGGYLEVREDKVTVLANAAEYASKMDAKELAQVKEDIQTKISSLSKDSEEFFAAVSELEFITSRLKIAEKRNK